MSNATQAVTRILLVRHGHVDGIDPPRFRGQLDLPLTALGIRQAEATRDLLLRLPRPGVAYASPLARCMTTARIIAQPLPLQVAPMQSFMDIDYGDWQGRSYAEVRQSDPQAFARWFDAPHLACMPGGETLLALAGRVAETMRCIAARHRGETVLLVGHDTVNRVMLMLALDLPLSRFWRLQQAPCAVNLLTHGAGQGWSVVSMNEAAHLQAVG